MFVLLPVFTANAIDVLLQNFTSEILEKILSEKTLEEVDVEFPKISFERKFKFVPVRFFLYLLIFSSLKLMRFNLI